MTFLNFTMAELKAVKADSLSVMHRSHRKGDVQKNTALRFPTVPLSAKVISKVMGGGA